MQTCWIKDSLHKNCVQPITPLHCHPPHPIIPLFGPRRPIEALVAELPQAIKDAIRRVGDPHPMNPLFGPRCTIGALVSELPLSHQGCNQKGEGNTGRRSRHIHRDCTHFNAAGHPTGDSSAAGHPQHRKRAHFKNKVALALSSFRYYSHTEGLAQVTHCLHCGEGVETIKHILNLCKK
jgi:hypothetical protein